MLDTLGEGYGDVDAAGEDAATDGDEEAPAVAAGESKDKGEADGEPDATGEADADGRSQGDEDDPPQAQMRPTASSSRMQNARVQLV